MDFFEIAERTAASLVGWRMARLRSFLDGPLAVVATGTTLALGALWARLHETTGQPAWSLTPADFRQRPLPPGTRTLLLSATGRHHDILGAARHAARPGSRLHAVVYDGSAPLCDLVRAGGGDVTVLPPPPPMRDLADPQVAVPMVVFAGTVYGLGPTDVFRTIEAPPPPERRPAFVLALGAGLAAPAAQALAGRCREAGLCLAASGDRRNVTHGDLVPLDPAGLWVVHFALPDDAPRLAAWDAHLPPTLGVTRVLTHATGTTGAIALYLKGGALFRAAAERFHACPTPGQLPDWIKGLYRLAEEQG